jgi:biopolymer transport protein ExbB
MKKILKKQCRRCCCLADKAKFFVAVLILITLLFPSLSTAADMRIVTKKAQQELINAKKAAKQSGEEISDSRATLKTNLETVQQEITILQESVTLLTADLAVLTAEDEELTARQADDDLEMNELAGTVRTLALDTQTLLNTSLLSPFEPQRLNDLKPILAKDRFPGIDDMQMLVSILFSEMQFSGEVSLRHGSFTDRSGQEQLGEILLVGPFTAVYRFQGEIGFLRPELGERLTALPVLPEKKIRKQLAAYMDGTVESCVFDPSGGSALKQVSHRITYIERIRNGGFFVWPILAIGVVALLIVLERTVFLSRVHMNTDKIMGKVNELALADRWSDCEKMIKANPGRPVCNILRAGLEGRSYDRETVDSILQEAILREVPRLERFLAVLHVFAAISPLLGLLGTVTGMIATFHVITLFGTGDPRLMAGGISEALITTMLGLCVAIPIMLAHTFLSRRVDHIIEDMEEKAVGLSNIIMREEQTV